MNANIEAEWDLENGFLGKLRAGDFDRATCQRLLETLSKVEPEGTLDRDFVRLVWYIPIFMEWNRERVAADSLKDYEKAANKILAEVERILGIP